MMVKSPQLIRVGGMLVKITWISLWFAFAVCYWNGISGAATSTRWAFLSVLLPILLILNFKRVSFTTLHLIGLLFIGWSILSLLWSSNVYDGIDSLIKLIIIAQVFLLGTYLTSLRDVFIGLGLGITVSSLYLLIGRDSAGLFANVNILAETALLVCVGLVIYRVWWLVPGVLPSIVLNGSRAAILSGVCLITLWIWGKSKIVALSVLIVGSITLVSRYKLGTLSERWTLWTDTIDGLTLLGHGLGSFFTSYQFYAEIDTLVSRPRFAHNDLLQICFEFGLIGGLLAALFIIRVLLAKANEKYVFMGFVIISMFSFPFYLPVSSFIAVLVCGFVARNWCSVRSTFVNSRMALREWDEGNKNYKEYCRVKDCD